MSAPVRTDVAVIGAGIAGASAAFFLRRRGKSVALIERGLAGQQASGVNFGNLRRQGRPFSQIPLANRARLIWRDLAALTGGDSEVLLSGHVRFCYTQERADMMRDYAREAAGLGLGLEIISGNALKERFPWIGPEIIAGSYSAEDGHANPRLAAPLFARAAAREGALVFENTEIVSAGREGGGFRLESAGGQVFSADTLLIAAGAWAGKFSAAFGEELPLVARGPQMAVTEPVPYAIRESVGFTTAIPEEGLYFRQIPRGNIIFGGGLRGPVDAEAVRAYVDPAATLHQIKEIQRAAPALRNLHVIRVWSGIEGYLPDENPALGASAKVPGLFYAFGFSGQGFQLGPGAGDVMAELIATGRTDTPIEAFHVKRFAPFV